jgi:hypothetical protein
MSRARAAQQSALEEVYGNTITISGVSYACAASVTPIEPELDERTMTMRDVQRAVIRVRRALLPVCPAATTRMVFQRLEWYVTSIGEQQVDSLIWKISIKRVITKPGV